MNKKVKEEKKVDRTKIVSPAMYNDMVKKLGYTAVDIKKMARGCPAPVIADSYETREELELDCDRLLVWTISRDRFLRVHIATRNPDAFAAKAQVDFVYNNAVAKLNALRRRFDELEKEEV